MKSIRSKLMAYFFIFVILFNLVAIAIYASSNQLMNEYNSSLQRFIILNSISQRTNQLYEKVNTFVVERDVRYVEEFQIIRRILEAEKNNLSIKMTNIDRFQLNKFENMIDTLIEQSELTIGFALRDDIDLYTYYFEEVQNTTQYIKETTLELIDLELTEYQNFYQQLNERNDSFRKFIVYLFSTSVLLAIIMALIFSKGINRPIQVLTKTAEEVSAGKLDGKNIEINSNDELKILGDTFNHMRNNIRELIDEIKKKSELDQLLKELELKHLQNQINPHFLFNTLNTISRTAYFENAAQTSKLIASVSSLLRYSLGDINKSVTLKEEVNVVKDYFHIQRTRFADRISFKTEIDDSCLYIEVPRLILQPLIENAFIHGVEGLEAGGEIRLTIEKAGNYAKVEIFDNGAGMDEKTIGKFMKLKNDPYSANHTGHTTGLGLENVIRRLQLYYNQQNIVHIRSNRNAGTTICLFLPITKGSAEGV
ncbi:MAG TPA: sensor histidine kinase [Bacillus sp. (in: firmicutes)]|uniref:sensor histidine kinase n=1 Tax=Bacillus litorisediminis TaxID=2922713 RepID=UPI001FACA2B3|nr:sensor histidine kinase [Bacillus litorisediminis]HWO76477.1 sensor histidine kinase [Bacillus sp. (in: firmicutes)]